jgi:hypothetical protein
MNGRGKYPALTHWDLLGVIPCLLRPPSRPQKQQLKNIPERKVFIHFHLGICMLLVRWDITLAVSRPHSCYSIAHALLKMKVRWKFCTYQEVMSVHPFSFFGGRANDNNNWWQPISEYPTRKRHRNHGRQLKAIGIRVRRHIFPRSML